MRRIGVELFSRICASTRTQQRYVSEQLFQSYYPISKPSNTPSQVSTSLTQLRWLFHQVESTKYNERKLIG